MLTITIPLQNTKEKGKVIRIKQIKHFNKGERGTTLSTLHFLMVY